MSYVIGIDPGLSGGIARICIGDLTLSEAYRYPGDAAGAADIVRQMRARGGKPKLAVIEKVQAGPHAGGSSGFTFGTNFGVWIGILSAFRIPYILVTPHKWRTACFDSGWKKNKSPQDVSLEMARRLFPHIDMKYKADDGKSDALHLARFGLLYLQSQGGKGE